ncbi:MAG: hypothetical protein KBC56_05990 [Flavobacterium sp.]|nr:hypothetical protein [Flavobacterium sp.]
MRFIKALLLVIIGLVVFSCVKEDQAADTFIMPLDIQYQRESVSIEKFLDEYQMNVDPANIENVTFEKLVAPIDPSKSIRVEHASKLKFKMVKSNGVNYKVYYVELREGSGDGIEQQNPIFVDSVLVNYRGLLLNKKANYKEDESFEKNQTFDSRTHLPYWNSLPNFVEGWGSILQMFKPGTQTVDPATNVITYNDFGAGVMFLPSGLAYYASSQGTIPAYSPLIFTFSLKRIHHVDTDFDGIDTIDEDVNGNGKYGDDDTDGDGRPNYMDIDDDGDGKLTKAELKYSVFKDGVTNYFYYQYSGAAVDDLSTPQDERGAPDCSGDQISSTRVRKYLDKNCQ